MSLPKKQDQHLGWKSQEMKKESLTDHAKTDSDDDDFNSEDDVDTPPLNRKETHPLLDDFEELDDDQSDMDEDAPNTDEL